jgi:2-oxoglutarate dehydrogenase E2 component (dihydrolipoamide succinyltransferase)
MDVGAVIARIETDVNQAKPVEETELNNETKKEHKEKYEAPKVEDPVVDISKKKATNDYEEKRFFTPVVNKIAQENNINNDELILIPGTGKSGRVTKLDILNYLKARNDSIKPNIESSNSLKPISSTFKGHETIVEMDHMRKLIANHMRESIDVSAHVYVMSEIDMTNIVNFVKKENNAFNNKEGYPLTYTPFIINACVKALGKYREMNASISQNNIIYHKDINIGMAVAIEKGLMVPVLKNCEELNFIGLCRKLRDISTRARNNQLTPDELQGSTFSISNFGVFNVTMGTPIINQPNVGILGVGAVKKRPVVIETIEGDTIGIKSMMILSLGFDHRLVDGAGGSKFIEMVKENIETINLEDLF